MATCYSILAWKIAWREAPGRPQSTESQRVGPNWVEQQKLISHILGITVLGCLGFHVLESLILSFFELFQQEAKFLSLHLDQKQKYHIILPLLTYGCSSPFLNCEVFNSRAVTSST